VLELSVDTAPYIRLGSRIRLGEGMAGLVAQTRQPLRLDDYSTWEGRSELYEGVPIRAVLEVPMLYRGELIGVLTADETGESRRKFTEEDERLLSLFASQAASAINNAKLFDSLQILNAELTQAYDATIAGWSRAMDLRDKETEGHTVRVSELASRLARAMDIDEAEIVHMRRGGLLHDIGKLGIPDSILFKDGKLTEEEWVVMRRHPTYAYEMLSQIDYLKPALTIPYCHHERWDGTGYPRGLKGEDIPLVARIFAFADVWDALRSDRPYRAGWSAEKVIEHIKSQAGTHFDPAIAEIFIDLMTEKTIKS
jgi:putative nucleotidyltransferase with HDIG domain